MLLESPEVHIWLADLQTATSELVKLYNLLSPDEHKRSSEYKFERDAQHYVCARGILRNLLSKFLAIDPQNVKFAYNEYGKPHLKNQETGNLLRFNLAHSYGLALYVFARDYQLGIDLEKIMPVENLLDIAQQFFSADEARCLQSVPTINRLESFYKCWTRKESVIKAIGKGLSFPLDRFTVTVAPNEPARIVDLQLDSLIPVHWNLYSIDTIPGYQAAVTLIGPDSNFNFKQFTYYSLD